jgi:hypothetical protein
MVYKITDLERSMLGWSTIYATAVPPDDEDDVEDEDDDADAPILSLA